MNASSGVEMREARPADAPTLAGPRYEFRAGRRPLYQRHGFALCDDLLERRFTRLARGHDPIQSMTR